jgi:hypothetical protein
MALGVPVLLKRIYFICVNDIIASASMTVGAVLLRLSLAHNFTMSVVRQKSRGRQNRLQFGRGVGSWLPQQSQARDKP